MMKRLSWGLVIGALALVGLARPADAQDARRYTFQVVGGHTMYDASSGLLDAQYGGAEALYNLSSTLSVGGYLLASRPTTDKMMFPLLRLNFGDTIFHYLISQQVVALDFGVNAAVRIPFDRFQLEGSAGAGRYVISLDPQRSQRPVVPGTEVTGMSGWEYLLGAGLNVALGESGGMHLKVRDFIYTGYDRNVLDLSEPMLPATVVPHPNPDPPEPKSTIHNLRFEVGFSFSPRGN